MCRARAKRAGIVRRRPAGGQSAPKVREPLYGAKGLVCMEYIGAKTGETEASVWTSIRYPYYPGRKFYTDARDAPRILAWRENGACVFREANGNTD